MGGVIAVHVTVTAAPDYFTRREAFRRAHIERLVGLRARGILVAGGPAPDGRTAELFYRLELPGDLATVIEEDPYRQGGVWTAYASRSFTHFVEPWEALPVVLDGSRRVTVVEGPAADPDMAQLALVELRGAGRLLFGGTFDDRETLAVLRSSDEAEATRWLAETGFWAAEQLAARPLIHVL
jgi:uncharacterized protein YciI